MVMFQQQLQQLSAEYERVCAVNAELRARLTNGQRLSLNSVEDEFSGPVSARSLRPFDSEQGFKQQTPRIIAFKTKSCESMVPGNGH